MKNNLFEAWWSLIGRFLRSLVMRLLRTGALVDCVVDMALTGLSLHRDDRRPMRHFQTCLADIGSNRGTFAEAPGRPATARLQPESNSNPRLADLRAAEITRPKPTSRRGFRNRSKRCIALGALAT